MANNNGKITAPVSIHDVRTALGTSSTDVGTLCKYADINRWARGKPQDAAQLAELTDTKRKELFWGLAPHTLNSVKSFPGVTEGVIKDAAPKWDYEQPTGGINSPYRLTDFNGYAADAPIPAWANISVNGKFLAVDFAFTGTAANGGIAPSELPIKGKGTALSELYPGVVVFRIESNGTYTFVFAATSPNKVKNWNGVTMYWGINTLGTGNFVAYALLSSAAITSNHTNPATTNWVTHVHGVRWQGFFDNTVVGTQLFTRQYVGADYYSIPATAITPIEMEYKGMKRYYFSYSGIGSTTLNPKSELYNALANQTRRLMITIEFINGLSKWVPFTEATSSTDFNGKKKTYAVPICAWRDTDADWVYLILKYVPVGAWPHTSMKWTATFNRGLALVNEAGREFWSNVDTSSADNTAITMVGGMEDNGGPYDESQSTIPPLRWLRVANIIDSQDTNVAGLNFMEMYGEYYDRSSCFDKNNDNAAADYAIHIENSGTALNFFGPLNGVTEVKNSAGTTLYTPTGQIPTPTNCYIDITADSEMNTPLLE